MNVNVDGAASGWGGNPEQDATKASRLPPESWTPSWSQSPMPPSASYCIKMSSPICPAASPSR